MQRGNLRQKKKTKEEERKNAATQAYEDRMLSAEEALLCL